MSVPFSLINEQITERKNVDSLKYVEITFTLRKTF
jgi:hypothetical protein